MEAAKLRVTQLMELLSESECQALEPVIADVAGGERFWERDFARCYHEYVKARPVAPKRGMKVDTHRAPGPVHTREAFVSIPLAKSLSHLEVHELPPPPPLELSLGDALARRRSRREFSGARASCAQISALLGHAAGISDRTEAYGYVALPRRTFPSSGGLQSPELYACVQNVEGLSPGLYHYIPDSHALGLLRPGDFSTFLGTHTFGQTFVSAAAVTLLITGVYDRLNWKYGERAYRYMCMDAGFLAQNLYLVGEALGLGVCAIAGFYDDDFEKLLGLDPAGEMMLLIVTIGVLGGRA